jgi:hypothetical protein
MGGVTGRTEPWTAPLPPDTSGGEGLASGRTGQGLSIPSRTDAVGLPWATRTTPANGDERAHVSPRLDGRHLRTGTRGRPRTRLKVLAAEKGYAAQDLRRRLRKRGIRLQSPTRVWKRRKPRGRQSNRAVPRDQAERTLAWCQRKYCRWVVRGERLAACFSAFLTMAMVHMWIHTLIVG